MKRIELSRKHGPFDPRWVGLRRRHEAARLDEEGPEPRAPIGLRTWESEGGAVLAERRRGPATV